LGILNWAAAVCAIKNTVAQRTRIKRNERRIFASYQLMEDVLFPGSWINLGIPELLVEKRWLWASQRIFFSEFLGNSLCASFIMKSGKL
jgi:hypothetical protein